MYITKKLTLAVALSTSFLMVGCTTSSGPETSQVSSAPETSQVFSGPETSQTTKKTTKFEGEMIGTPAKDSLFAKLEFGMSQNHVTSLIGSPTDSHYYRSGKEWIPFYFGRDISRMEVFYKNEGRLIFGGNKRLIKIIVDTSEDGFR